MECVKNILTIRENNFGIISIDIFSKERIEQFFDRYKINFALWYSRSKASNCKTYFSLFIQVRVFGTYFI